MRRRLRSLMESHDWIVCGEAANGREALQMIRQVLPDVVLLDLTMPDISGLEVLRRLANDGPPADVLALSVHRIPELAREVIRAGAAALIDKSEAWEKLAAAVRALRSEPRLAGHVGAFFNSGREAYRDLRPLICEGLREGERAIHIVDARERNAHFGELAQCGVDVRRAQMMGQLEVLAWDEAYLRDGHFDPDAMLERIQNLLRHGPTEGFPKSRLVARMEWALSGLPGVGRLAEYESRLNEVLPQFNDVVACVYDVSRFPTQVIDDVMRSHPAVIVDGVFHETNPRYVPQRAQ